MSSLSAVAEHTLKLTPSSVYNNLSVANGTCAFASKKDTVVVNGSVCRVIPQQDQRANIVAVSMLPVSSGSATLLFITTTSTTTVWHLQKDSAVLTIPHGEGSPCTAAGVADVTGQGDRIFVAAGQQSGKMHFSVVDCHGMTASTLGLRDGHAGMGLVTCCSGAATSSHVRMVSGSANGELILWDGSSAVLSRISPLKDECVTGVAIDSTYVAAAFGAGTIRLFQAGTGRLHMEILAHARWINAIAYDPVSRRLASCGDDGLVCVWGLPTDENPRGAQLVGYAQRQNTLWTGIAFTAPGVVTAVAYDSDKITTFNTM